MKIKWRPKTNTEKEPSIPPRAQAVIDAYRDPEQQKTDPNGSYTGINRNPHEIPIQDVDDL